MEEITAPVEPIIAEVESEGGVVSVHELGETVTVAITSDVLFAFDRADFSPEAQARLRDVAGQISTDGAGGVVTIAGHTDDQGSDAYNDDLSLRRAESVRAALEGLLASPDVTLPGVTLEAEGFGDREPRLPNVVDGQPTEEDRARNRRVEIIFTAKQE